MPVEQRDPRQTAKAITLGLAAVGAAVGFLLLVLWFADRGAVEIALGDDVFEAGRTDIIAEEIADNGPIKYGDLLGGRQNIILQHLGDDPETGWYAFDLIRPGQPPECQLDWNLNAQAFRDSCDGTDVPPTGFGQPSYEVIVEDGRLSVDLRGDNTTSPTDPTDS